MKTRALFIVVVSLVVGCQTAQEKQIGLGEPIQHDDFVYSVQRIITKEQIGTLKPAGRFGIVTFQVRNRAVRLAHPWLNTTAYVVGPDKRTYENRVDAQQRLNIIQPFGWQTHYLTPAGQTASTQLVFDLPTSVQRPYLQVRG